MVAPGGSPDADRFRPLRSGRSTSSLTNALLTVQRLLPFFDSLKLARFPACSLLPSSLYLLCRAPRALHSSYFELLIALCSSRKVSQTKSSVHLETMNGANGMSDIEGEVTRAGASERGQRTSFKIGCRNFCKGLFLKAGWRWVDRKEKAL